MKIQNNNNNNIKPNFKGALKLNETEAQHLLSKLDLKFPNSKGYKTITKDGTTNINFTNTRVEKSAMVSLEREGANIQYYMHWNKQGIKQDEFQKFVDLKMDPKVDKKASIEGAIKMPGYEVELLTNAIQKRQSKNTLDAKILESLRRKKDDSNGVFKVNELSVPIIASGFKAVILNFFKLAKTPDYIIYKKPLTLEEFKEFFASKVY